MSAYIEGVQHLQVTFFSGHAVSEQKKVHFDFSPIHPYRIPKDSNFNILPGNRPIRSTNVNPPSQQAIFIQKKGILPKSRGIGSVCWGRYRNSTPQDYFLQKVRISNPYVRIYGALFVAELSRQRIQKNIVILGYFNNVCRKNI